MKYRSLLSGITILTVWLVILFLPVSVGAVQQIKTNYFYIYYEPGSELIASEVAEIADKTLQSLMSLFEAFEDNPSIHVLVTDNYDLAGGWTNFYESTIVIFTTNMDLEIRGIHPWVRNVFVHELSHLVSLKKASKGPINFAALSLMKFDDNPDFRLVLPYYHLASPAWFTEGIAQFSAEKFGSESWDSHRDMLLRAAFLEDRLLTLDEMGVLAHDGYLSEMSYNQGYSLVNFIATKYGNKKLVAINNNLGYFTLDSSIKKALGKTPKDLYREWKKNLAVKYNSGQYSEGNLVFDEGTLDFFPRISPDGKYLAFLSSHDYEFAITDLYLQDLTTGKVKKIMDRVEQRFNWSSDSQKIVFSKRPETSIYLYDIFTYDIPERKARRISRGLRTKDPSFSPDGNSIVFVHNEGGKNNLAIMDSDGSNVRYLTNAQNGTQFYAPVFSPDGKEIIFSLFHNDDLDIGRINADSPTYTSQWEIGDSTCAFSDSICFTEDSGFQLVIHTQADEREPFYTPDGKSILFSSDRDGIFNIYRYMPGTDHIEKLTNVPGGAFCPNPAPDGKTFYYASYHANNYNIYTNSLDKVIEKVSLATVSRDYITQKKQKKISDIYSIGRYTRKYSISQITPILGLGPSFIGYRFGLDVLSLGGEIAWGDILGYDQFYVSGNVGKNLKKDIDINTDILLYYQKRITSVISTTSVHAPTFYGFYRHREINNVFNRLNALIDTTYTADLYDYTDVFHDIHFTQVVDDTYKDVFNYFSTGVNIPLTRRNQVSISYNYRNFTETIDRVDDYRDYSTITTSDGIDISNQFSGIDTVIVTKTDFYTNMNYFKDRNFSISWRYLKLKPTRDRILNPTGGRVIFAQFKTHAVTVADTLADPISIILPIDLNNDGFLDQYPLDPFSDRYRPLMKDIRVNEYILGYGEFIELPNKRHTLSFQGFVRYLNKRLKDVRVDEGGGYNWPLRMYLGGESILAGYSYFTLRGSKVFYAKANYVFPLLQNIHKQMWLFYLDKLYAEIFFEAGRAWNFEKLSWDNLKAGSFKRDVGVELNLGLITYYRVPIRGYFKIAWPLDRLDPHPRTSIVEKRDNHRIYFGITF